MSKAKPPELPAATAELHATVSGLRVQRDSHQRRATELDAQNRQLRHHQNEIVAWVDDALQRWENARDTDQALVVADQIHARAKTILAEARRAAARSRP